MTPDFEAWLSTKPPLVREVARKFPPGSHAEIHGRTYWVIAYAQTADPTKVLLRFTPVNPNMDYEGAMAAEPIYICADHFATAPKET
jgi:hypothetical protein